MSLRMRASSGGEGVWSRGQSWAAARTTTRSCASPLTCSSAPRHPGTGELTPIGITMLLSAQRAVPGLSLPPPAPPSGLVIARGGEACRSTLGGWPPSPHMLPLFPFGQPPLAPLRVRLAAAVRLLHRCHTTIDARPSAGAGPAQRCGAVRRDGVARKSADGAAAGMTSHPWPPGRCALVRARTAGEAAAQGSWRTPAWGRGRATTGRAGSVAPHRPGPMCAYGSVGRRTRKVAALRYGLRSLCARRCGKRMLLRP